MSDNLLDKVYSLVDSSQTALINRLRDAVQIQSVSAENARRPDVVRMVEWTKKQLESLGAVCELCPLPRPSDSPVDLPPVLFGTLGSDPNKKTLVIYGHLDVQPAKKEDGWATDPFDLTEINGKLLGRGSSDDKGPVVAWINAIEAMQKVGLPIPVNIKFAFEGMEESGSIGLEELLDRRRDFLSGTSFVCISDNYWLGTKKPCITYGLRGLCYFAAEVSRPSSDMHSGLHGGVVKEPLAELMWLMSQLITDDGKPNIPKLAEMVRPVDEAEMKTYGPIDFDVQQYKHDLGAVLHSEDKAEVLMRRWRFPSLSLHGIEGAFSDPGAKTVIPAKVIGKFSIRIVPDMKPTEVEKVVTDHLNNLWKTKAASNNLKISMAHAGKSWMTDTNSANYKAAHQAIHKVYGVEPDYTREGGSIPITITFQELTGVPVLLLPIGASDDNPHAQNEKIDVRNYVQGTKLLATYLVELGKI